MKINTPTKLSSSAVTHYVNEYQRVEKNLVGHQLESLRARRKIAQNNLANLGFPHRKDPDWKYTDLTSLLQTPFSTTTADINSKLSLALATTNNKRLVFINGYFSKALSHITSLSNNSIISHLADVIKNNPEHLLKHWQTDNNTKNNFINLNTAFFQDGAYLYLAKDTKLASPIELLFISTEEQRLIPVRNIIIAEKNSHAVIIEKYITLNETTNTYFSNAVSECFLAPQSQLTHYKLIEESKNATHISNINVVQQEKSQFSAYSLLLSGALIRNDTHVKLAQTHAQCHLKSLYYAQEKQHIDQQTIIDHISPFTSSTEFYTGLIADHAHAVFNGKIIVRPQAIKSKAEQLNKNLLLSPYAEVNSKPQLEIFVDDIQCTHGASIGQLDENALFYLRARGLTAIEARSLLIKAFIHDIIQQMSLLNTDSTLSPLLKNLFNYESV